MPPKPRPARPAGALPRLRRYDPREKLKLEIHEALTSKVNLIEASAAHSDTEKLAELRAKIEEATQQVLSEKTQHELTAEDISQIREEIVNESLGLGPLEDLMADPAVSEIMVNGPQDRLRRARR